MRAESPLQFRPPIQRVLFIVLRTVLLHLNYSRVKNMENPETGFLRTWNRLQYRIRRCAANNLDSWFLSQNARPLSTKIKIRVRGRACCRLWVMDYMHDAKSASRLAHSKGFASSLFKIPLCMSFAIETS
jgi:hypothetical protein